MCGMSLYSSGCSPLYGHLAGSSLGMMPGYGYGTGYRGYGHLQGYGVGLHPGYDPYGSDFGYMYNAAYPVYYPVHHYIERPFRGGKG